MSTLLDRIESRSTNGRTGCGQHHARRTAPHHHGRLPGPVHLVRHQKSLTAEQKAQAAEPFDAEGQFLSAGKKLLDTKHTAFRAVTAIRTKISDYWKGLYAAVPRAGRPADQADDQVEGFDQPDGRLQGRAG